MQKTNQQKLHIIGNITTSTIRRSDYLSFFFLIKINIPLPLYGVRDGHYPMCPTDIRIPGFYLRIYYLVLYNNAIYSYKE